MTNKDTTDTRSLIDRRGFLGGAAAVGIGAQSLFTAGGASAQSSKTGTIRVWGEPGPYGGAGVAAMNGMANHLEYQGFPEAIAESFGGPKTAIPEEYKKRSAEYWPERLTMPVGLSTGGRDDVVPPESVRRLADVLCTIPREPRGPYAAASASVAARRTAADCDHSSGPAGR